MALFSDWSQVKILLKLIMEVQQVIDFKGNLYIYIIFRMIGLINPGQSFARRKVKISAKSNFIWYLDGNKLKCALYGFWFMSK